MLFRSPSRTKSACSVPRTSSTVSNATSPGCRCRQGIGRSTQRQLPMDPSTRGRRTSTTKSPGPSKPATVKAYLVLCFHSPPLVSIHTAVPTTKPSYRHDALHLELRHVGLAGHQSYHQPRSMRLYPYSKKTYPPTFTPAFWQIIYRTLALTSNVCTILNRGFSYRSRSISGGPKMGFFTILHVHFFSLCAGAVAGFYTILHFWVYDRDIFSICCLFICYEHSVTLPTTRW